MCKTLELMETCRNLSLHCSVTYQSITSYSVEIYTGYVSTYKEVFYTDGKVSLEEAIDLALEFLENEY